MQPQEQSQPETNPFKMVLNDLRAGEQIDSDLREEIVDGLLSNESGERITEEVKAELLGYLLFDESEKTQVDIERVRLIDEMREKIDSGGFFQGGAGESDEIGGVEMMFCDTEATDKYDSCMYGILELAWEGTLKKDIVDCYVNHKLPENKGDLYMFEYLEDNSENRERVEKTVENALKSGIIREAHGLIFSGLGRKIYEWPPFSDKLREAEDRENGTWNKVIVING